MKKFELIVLSLFLVFIVLVFLTPPNTVKEQNQNKILLFRDEGIVITPGSNLKLSKDCSLVYATPPYQYEKSSEKVLVEIKTSEGIVEGKINPNHQFVKDFLEVETEEGLIEIAKNEIIYIKYLEPLENKVVLSKEGLIAYSCPSISSHIQHTLNIDKNLYRVSLLIENKENKELGGEFYLMPFNYRSYAFVTPMAFESKLESTESIDRVNEIFLENSTFIGNLTLKPLSSLSYLMKESKFKYNEDNIFITYLLSNTKSHPKKVYEVEAPFNLPPGEIVIIKDGVLMGERVLEKSVPAGEKLTIELNINPYIIIKQNSTMTENATHYIYTTHLSIKNVAKNNESLTIIFPSLFGGELIEGNLSKDERGYYTTISIPSNSSKDLYFKVIKMKFLY